MIDYNELVLMAKEKKSSNDKSADAWIEENLDVIKDKLVTLLTGEYTVVRLYPSQSEQTIDIIITKLQLLLSDKNAFHIHATSPLLNMPCAIHFRLNNAEPELKRGLLNWF